MNNCLGHSGCSHQTVPETTRRFVSLDGSRLRALGTLNTHLLTSPFSELGITEGVPHVEITLERNQPGSCYLPVHTGLSFGWVSWHCKLP